MSSVISNSILMLATIMFKCFCVILLLLIILSIHIHSTSVIIIIVKLINTFCVILNLIIHDYEIHVALSF